MVFSSLINAVILVFLLNNLCEFYQMVTVNLSLVFALSTNVLFITVHLDRLDCSGFMILLPFFPHVLIPSYIYLMFCIVCDSVLLDGLAVNFQISSLASPSSLLPLNPPRRER